MFKKFCLWASAAVFFLSTVGFLTTFSLLTLFRPNYIKSWTKASGAYQSLSGVIISENGKARLKKASTAAEQFPLTDALVQKAAKSALSSDFFQNAFETVIDGSFKWLDREVATPSFAVDVLSAKQNFVDRLGDLIKERYDSLPACGDNLPTSTNILKINCQPEGQDIDQLISEQKVNLLNDRTFLSQALITADSFGGKDGSSIFKQQAEIPNYYRWAKLLPKVFGGLMLVSAIFVVALCQSKKFGVRKLGWRLTIAGFLSLILTAVGAAGITEARQMALEQNPGTVVHSYREIVAAGLTAMRADTAKLSGGLAGVSIVTGGAILVATRSVSKKKRKQAKSSAAQSEQQDNQASVPEISTKGRPEAKAPAAKPTPTPTPTAPAVKPAAKPKPRRPNLIQ